MDFAENSSQEHDVDAIIAQAYGNNSDTSSQQEPIPTPQQQPTPQAPVEPQYKEYEFNHRGQAIKIKENDPRFTQWMSQGYDYAQNIADIRTQREDFEKSRNEWEGKWNVYKEIDQYAQKNPDWWNHTEQSYQQKLSTPNEVPDQVRQYLDQRLQALEPVAQDIPLMKQFLQEIQTQKMEKQQQDEDTQLTTAIKSIQTKYPDLDFNAKDESGLSLEARVLQHAQQNGFPTFRGAFLDYYHDSLEKQAEARGKEVLMQEMNKRKKLGLLDDAPAQGNRMPSSTQKPRSWSDPQLSSDHILKEFKFS